MVCKAKLCGHSTEGIWCELKGNMTPIQGMDASVLALHANAGKAWWNDFQTASQVEHGTNCHWTMERLYSHSCVCRTFQEEADTGWSSLPNWNRFGKPCHHAASKGNDILEHCKLWQRMRLPAWSCCLTWVCRRWWSSFIYALKLCRDSVEMQDAGNVKVYQLIVWPSLMMRCKRKIHFHAIPESSPLMNSLSDGPSLARVKPLDPWSKTPDLCLLQHHLFHWLTTVHLSIPFEYSQLKLFLCFKSSALSYTTLCKHIAFLTRTVSEQSCSKATREVVWLIITSDSNCQKQR